MRQGEACLAPTGEEPSNLHPLRNTRYVIRNMSSLSRATPCVLTWGYAFGFGADRAIFVVRVEPRTRNARTAGTAVRAAFVALAERETYPDQVDIGGRVVAEAAAERGISRWEVGATMSGHNGREIPVAGL